jgi:hypothetical protein
MQSICSYSEKSMHSFINSSAHSSRKDRLNRRKIKSTFHVVETNPYIQSTACILIHAFFHPQAHTSIYDCKICDIERKSVCCLMKRVVKPGVSAVLQPITSYLSVRATCLVVRALQRTCPNRLGL